MNNPPLAVHINPSSDSADYPGNIGFDNVSSQLNKNIDGRDVIFNPEVKQQVDINLIHTLMQESTVRCVTFSRDGKYLATGGDKAAQIFDMETGQRLCLLVHTDTNGLDVMYVFCARFSPDGKYLATGASDTQIRIWDISEKCVYKVFDEHQLGVISLDFSPNGRFIASCSTERLIRIWDIVDDTSKVLPTNDYDSFDNENVYGVAISPNGQYVASGSYSSVVRIRDLHTGQLLERLWGHEGIVFDIAFTPDGRGLVSGGLGSVITLKHWDISALGNGLDAAARRGRERKRSGKSCPCTMNFTGHGRDSDVYSVAVSYDGKWVVAGLHDGWVSLWDVSHLG